VFLAFLAQSIGCTDLSKTKANTSEMDNEAKITLGLLNMVHDNAQASQRSMADDLGIALGLANAY
jgi:hypothetical protein